MTKVGILATARQANGGTLLYSLSMIEALRRLPQDHVHLTIYTQSDNHEYDQLGLAIVREILANPLTIFRQRDRHALR